MTRPKFLAATVAALALLLSACGNDDTTPGTTPDVTTSPTDATGSPTASGQEGDAEVGAQEIVTLSEQNGSGIAGSATLVQTAPGITTVTVTLTGAEAGPQPIHIHPGTCEQLDPAPRYPLTNVENGRSTTEVNVGLETLRDGEFAVNVHKSPQEAQVYVACGNITAA